MVKAKYSGPNRRKTGGRFHIILYPKAKPKGAYFKPEIGFETRKREYRPIYGTSKRSADFESLRNFLRQHGFTIRLRGKNAGHIVHCDGRLLTEKDIENRNSRFRKATAIWEKKGYSSRKRKCQ